MSERAPRLYTLIDATGRPYRSPTPGRFGGHHRGRIYGRLDCPSALRALAHGHYRSHRVFFADEVTALSAGYRPCAVCMQDRYVAWKAAQRSDGESKERTGEIGP
ncbi:Ada metal-binding domain-containing protein [Nocardia sp. GCM10030253]|uniref:Ada metal-binding domain-containing protein n=1 Tax=Nocardia sp. GCM10030253 TaxID=3273404 RepID=UPI003629A712